MKDYTPEEKAARAKHFDKRRKIRQRIRANHRATEAFASLSRILGLAGPGAVTNSSTTSLRAALKLLGGLDDAWGRKRLQRLRRYAVRELNRRNDMSRLARGEINREHFLSLWATQATERTRREKNPFWQSPAAEIEIADRRRGKQIALAAGMVRPVLIKVKGNLKPSDYVPGTVIYSHFGTLIWTERARRGRHAKG